MLNAIEVLFLPMFFYLAFFSTYYDLKYRRVPNKIVYPFLLLAIFLDVVFCAKFHYPVMYVFLVFIFSVFLSVLLFYLDFWSAGDAKTYIAFSTLFHPLSLSVEVFLFPFLIFSTLFFIFSLLEALLKKKKIKLRLRKETLYASLSVFFGSVGNLIFVAPLFFVLISKYFSNFDPLLLFFFSFVFNPKLAVLSVLLGLIYDNLIEWINSPGEIPSAPFISLSFFLYLFLY